MDPLTHTSFYSFLRSDDSRAPPSKFSDSCTRTCIVHGVWCSTSTHCVAVLPPDPSRICTAGISACMTGYLSKFRLAQSTSQHRHPTSPLNLSITRPANLHCHPLQTDSTVPELLDALPLLPLCIHARLPKHTRRHQHQMTTKLLHFRNKRRM